MSWFRRLWNRLCAWLARCGLLPRSGIFYIGGSDTLPPPLSREVEAEMLARLDEGDFEVRQILIEHNLRLVAYIARRFDNTGINIEDLISIGTIGLIKAINTYRSDKNIKLATYASRCKKTFTGTATILTDDPSRGRHITLENEDLSYQNKLKLFSMNSGYIIGYKRGDDGVEYRYLADANGNIVNAENAKATADLGAGEQELDTATVVPEDTPVTVTANIPEGAEFLGWSAVRADGIALKLGDDQTAHFKMPGCNVTVEALYQGGNGDIDNPSGGGSSDVVAGIAAVALTGAAVWGIYETGTGIYRVLNMPGVPMPSNRAGLATLIWEKAGCPEPQTVKSFSDIDDADLHLRQAASWMEEQGLMDDVKENEFRPYRYVTKLQTCLVWDKAKEESLIS